MTCGLSVFAAPLAFADNDDREAPTRHVLLISVDGMHALDLHNCVIANTCPNLSALAHRGVNYIRTSTSKPSDSFPGLMAIITGGTPKLVGAYYDVAYDRVLAPPASDTCNGLLHGACVEGQANGARTEYEEGVDIDQTALNGGGPYGMYDGGYKSVDPKKLPRDPFKNCAPVAPWNFIRANTVYGVIHNAGGYTAWSDKHAVYAAVSGPTGTDVPSNLDDFYSPEVNSNSIGLPGVKTATGLNCSVVNGGDWTTDFDNIKCYDQLKVNAVLNWIQGRTHTGTHNGRHGGRYLAAVAQTRGEYSRSGRLARSERQSCGNWPNLLRHIARTLIWLSRFAVEKRRSANSRHYRRAKRRGHLHRKFEEARGTWRLRSGRHQRRADRVESEARSPYRHEFRRDQSSRADDT